MSAAAVNSKFVIFVLGNSHVSRELHSRPCELTPSKSVIMSGECGQLQHSDEESNCDTVGLIASPPVRSTISTAAEAFPPHPLIELSPGSVSLSFLSHHRRRLRTHDRHRSHTKSTQLSYLDNSAHGSPGGARQISSIVFNRAPAWTRDCLELQSFFDFDTL